MEMVKDCMDDVDSMDSDEALDHAIDEKSTDIIEAVSKAHAGQGLIARKSHHRTKTVDDEIQLLKEITDLEKKILVQREKARVANTSHGRKYAEIFEPITQSIKNILPNTDRTHHAADFTQTPYAADLMEFTQTPHAAAAVPDLLDDTIENKHSLPPPMQPMNVSSDEKPEVSPGDSLYVLALSSIPRKDRDDGVFGLNWRLKKIGDCYFTATGNTLKVEKSDGTETSFTIDDINVWKLLLTQRPGRLMALMDNTGRFIPAVREYVDIVKELNLVPIARRNNEQYRNRVKYKLIEASKSSKGSGLLSPFIMKPSTLVIPSDRKGLL